MCVPCGNSLWPSRGWMEFQSELAEEGGIYVIPSYYEDDVSEAEDNPEYEGSQSEELSQAGRSNRSKAVRLLVLLFLFIAVEVGIRSFRGVG